MLLVSFGLYLLVLLLQYLPITPSPKIFSHFNGSRTEERKTKTKNEAFRTLHDRLELEALTSAVGITFIGATAGDQLGYSVCVGGDFNGDSKADILIGAPGYSSSTGRVYAIYGAASLSSLDMSLFSDGITITGTTGSGLGTKVDIGGDANGDSKADMFVGAPSLTSSTGAAYVIYGGASLTSVTTSSLSAAAGVTFTGSGTNAFTGFGLTLNYDHNQDGIADPVIGAYGVTSIRGRTYRVLGSAALASTAVTSIASDSYLSGPVGAGKSGYSVDSGGDTNGDGTTDLMIGTPATAAGGTVSVLFGGITVDWTLVNGLVIPVGDGFTITGPAAGCLTGESVSLGGDVNGDGISDMLIGAPGCSSGAGTVYLIFGSVSPTSFTLSDSMSQGVSFTGATPGDEVGASVAIGGDFNGDGKADILIGAPGYSSSTGIVYLIYGSASLTNIALTNFSGSNGIKITGEYGGCYTGFSVNMRGDVDGDGYADILIGAYGYASSKGKVYLIYSTASPANILLASDTPTYTPTRTPTAVPTTASPTFQPSPKPTMTPTRTPTAIPTQPPTFLPSSPPSKSPTIEPTGNCFFVLLLFFFLYFIFLLFFLLVLQVRRLYNHLKIQPLYQLIPPR
jgi:hypothetical protein